jgi:hypothetical protein
MYLRKSGVTFCTFLQETDDKPKWQIQYSKAPHKRTSELRTTSLKFGQLSTQNTSFLK